MLIYLNDLMQFLLDIVKDPVNLIQLVGFWGMVLIIFAETGLLAGFFLPGDSLLVAAGILTSHAVFDIWHLGLALTIAAIVGDSVGFFIGKKLGSRLYSREDSFFFRKKHLLKVQAFYEKNGGKTIILARFIPIVRTFAPTVAGAAAMPYGRFVAFNILGGLLWIWGMLFVGYFAGKNLGENIIHYIHYIIVGIVVLSLLPVVIEWWKERKK